ncbi:putative efflux pump outer membrane protein TtgC precursor [Mariprofundus micogutta]|uniref:Putative efflux pump outer membrane protein TtgC n=1 Tax=Mariprofundus micogutta TaxID=1921010 RepID=A0A1L8CMJ7_9PROT|nr:efflux transporter outer membrane subunit [Mariprofundus micogutta]GAV20125.1 putative efflux pump outer membrane protein TtgC precursor [Mariprofundus micogutta]
MSMPKRNAALPLLSVLMIAGCAVGPDFQSPQASSVKQYSSEQAALKLDVAPDQPKLVQSDTVPALWWQLFESKDLEQLVTLGLQESPTLAAARARLKAAEESFSADHSSILFPSVDASLSSSRQKISGAAFGNPGNGSQFAVHTASVDISYSIDLFGGGQRYLEAGLAQVEFERFQLQAAQITLTTNIVTTAINEASLREQITAMQEIITAEAENLKVAELQFEIGVMAKADLLSQRTSLAQRRTQLPALQKALAQTRHQLATLVGKMPGDMNLPKFAFDTLNQPQQIPVTLPSTLTRQRADVRAAEALLHQASAQVGIATANLYPNIGLSGSYGTEAVKLADLFSAGTAIWGLGAGILQPLFRAGELHARKRAAIAGFEQVAAEYRSSVLLAFQDVADALLALQVDGRQLELEKQSEQMASETLELVNLQHEQGAVSLLTLLNAQQQYQESKISLIKARAALYTDTAALMYALGGGWWNQGAVQTVQDDETNTEKQL